VLNTHTPELPIRSADPVVDAKTTRIGAAVRVRGDIMETSSHAAADEDRAAEGIKHQPEPPLDPSKHEDRTIACAPAKRFRAEDHYLFWAGHCEFDQLNMRCSHQGAALFGFVCVPLAIVR